MPLIWTEDVVVDFLFRLKTNPYILILSLFISVIFCCGLRFNGAILLKFERDLYFRITKRPCKSLKKFANYFLIYADFKISIGQGSCSTEAIFVKFELDLVFIISKRPAKFHWNRSRTFWVILITESQTNKQTEPQTESQTHTSKTIPLSQTKFGAR